jgi:hypothetical protein
MEIVSASNYKEAWWNKEDLTASGVAWQFTTFYSSIDEALKYLRSMDLYVNCQYLFRKERRNFLGKPIWH